MPEEAPSRRRFSSPTCGPVPPRCLPSGRSTYPRLLASAL